eukprot:gene678-3978_t
MVSGVFMLVAFVISGCHGAGLFPSVSIIAPTIEVACQPSAQDCESSPFNLTEIVTKGADTSVSWRSPIGLHQINITFDLHGLHELSGFEIEMERMPKTAILFRSSDGVTFHPYQFYAFECDASFNLPSDTVPQSPDDVICVSSGTSPSGETRLSFNPTSAQRLGGVPFNDNLAAQHFVRTQFLRLALLEYHESDTAQDAFGNPLPVYEFYEITSISVSARCFCNGHANECFLQGVDGEQQSICNCQHNTMGTNCEMCHPLYNNKPFRSGTSDASNACKPCECNRKADSCEFDESFGLGVCIDCQDNTDGISCETCMSNHYSVNTSSVLLACIPCNCSEQGSISQQCDIMTGACICKKNTLGRMCTECHPGTFGYGQDDEDGCLDCNCSDHGSQSDECDVYTGQCPCKPGAVGRTCNGCDVGFYSTGLPGDCLSCHSACDDTGCIAPGPMLGFACRSCRHAVLEGECVEDCPSNYWKTADAVCRRCDHQCLDSCFDSGPSSCHACKHFQENGVCVAVCSPGSYMNNSVCLPCHDECDSQGCRGPKATDCMACKSFLSNGTCVSSCPTDTIISNGFRCLPCHPMCATGSGCVGETALDCNECKFAAHQLPDTSKTVCVAGCDASEYLDSSGICQSCDSECRLGCKGPGANECTLSSCRRFMFEDTCIGVCPVGTFPNEEKLCQPCAQECGTGCWGPGKDECFSCSTSTFALVQLRAGTAHVTCVETCPTSTFSDQQRVCRPCDDACVSCTSPGPGGCTACSGVFDTSAEICLQTCQADEYEASEPIDVSSIDAIGYCFPCDPLCAGCTGPTNKDCRVCRGVLHNETCLATCVSNTFRHGGHCLPCHAECKDGCAGPGPTQCHNCLNVRGHDGTCRNECQPWEYVDAAQTCHLCHPLCSTTSPGCTGPFPTNCSACSNARELQTNACVSTCPDGTFEQSQGNDRLCVPCHETCSQCTGSSPTDCSKCKHARLNNECVVQCPIRMFLSSAGVCTTCHAECSSSCNGSSSFDCRLPSGSSATNLCKHVHHHGQCRPSCPHGYFPDSLRNCLQCHPSCAACTGEGSNNCTECRSNHFLTANVGICVPCHPLCKGKHCTGPSAMDCSEGCLSATDVRQPDVPICVATCPMRTYSVFGPRGLECRSCSQQCAGMCVGPGNSNCTLCTSFEELGVCVPACSSATAPDEFNECLPCHRECHGGCRRPGDANSCFGCMHVEENDRCVAQCSSTRPFVAREVCVDSCPGDLPFYNDTRQSEIFLPAQCVAACSELQDSSRVFISDAYPYRCTTESQARTDTQVASTSDSSDTTASLTLWIVVACIGGFLLTVLLVLFVGRRRRRTGSSSISSESNVRFVQKKNHDPLYDIVPGDAQLFGNYTHDHISRSDDDGYITVTPETVPTQSTHV